MIHVLATKELSQVNGVMNHECVPNRPEWPELLDHSCVSSAQHLHMPRLLEALFMNSITTW